MIVIAITGFRYLSDTKVENVETTDIFILRPLTFLIVIAQFPPKTFFEITVYLIKKIFLVDHLEKIISGIPYKEMVSLQNE